MARKRTGRFVYAKQGIAIAVGAQPVVYKRGKVLNRRTQQADEIDIHEHKPVQDENVGTHYVFAAGERVPADHPAVKAKPSAFMFDAPDDEPAAVA